jgi:hypothetical protein
LPPEVSKYKIIQTLNGNFSIPEILDALKEEDKLYYLTQRDPGLEELLKKDKKMVFLDQSIRLFVSGQKEVIISLASGNKGANPYDRYIDATRVYSASLRVEEGSVGEREKFFLDAVSRNLPITIRAKMSELYFTSNSKMGYVDPEPVIFRSSSGKINLGEPKKSIARRIKNRAVNIFYQDPYDVALNLDSRAVQNMVSLVNGGNEFSRDMAISMIINTIAEKFPVPTYTSYSTRDGLSQLLCGGSYRSRH